MGLRERVLFRNESQCRNEQGKKREKKIKEKKKKKKSGAAGYFSNPGPERGTWLR